MKRLLFLTKSLSLLLFIFFCSCKKNDTTSDSTTADHSSLKEDYVAKMKKMIEAQKAAYNKNNESGMASRDTNFIVPSSGHYVDYLDFSTTELIQPIEDNGDTAILFNTSFFPGVMIDGQLLEGGLVSVVRPDGEYLNVILNDRRTSLLGPSKIITQIRSMSGCMVGSYELVDNSVTNLSVLPDGFVACPGDDPNPVATLNVRKWLECTGNCVGFTMATCYNNTTCRLMLFATRARGASAIAASCGIYCAKNPDAF